MTYDQPPATHAIVIKGELLERPKVHLYTNLGNAELSLVDMAQDDWEELAPVRRKALMDMLGMDARPEQVETAREWLELSKHDGSLPYIVAL